MKKIKYIFILFMSFWLSIYANLSQNAYAQAGYSVYGRNYLVMRTSKNYQARGVASWYGPRFHKRRTSSGERYNMYKLTAAHKSLPLNTYVQVTNLRNGRKVTVKINDRGPFVSHRLIDLSYGAAKKIGMVSRGTTPVAIKTIT